MFKFEQRLKGIAWLDDDLVKMIFDNVRNITLCALVSWAGTSLYLHPRPPAALLEKLVGGMLIYASLLLLALNLLHGIKKLWELRVPRLFLVVASTAFYVAVVAFFVILYRSKMPT
jgi:hypothetical protein